MAAIIGGLVTALFIFVGEHRLDDGSGDVTIRKAPPPVGEVSENSAGVPVREVYTRSGPGVVSVDVASSEAGPGGGSGFVIDEQGHIVTNQHVIGGAEEISVRFASGVREVAEVVGEDPSTDVAVIKVDASEDVLEPLTLGDSRSVGVGEPVIAIGNPLNVGISVTTGIVSGTERPIDAPNGYTIDGAVQTDAAINPGNSGGPLLDSRGTVIGVNAQIATESGGFEGVGFAVPIDTVKGVVEQLISSGEAVHGYIGVRMFAAGIDELAAYTGLSNEELAEQYGLPSNGAIVSEVTTGGPAAKAGVAGGEEEEIEGVSVPIGDVITEVNGEPVSSPDDVIEVVNSSEPGDELALTVVSPGEEARRVGVTVGVRPEDT
ncbi:MAG TPA: trypsin-like peptidase domain-containing protein [Rubrobacteraceae bacterium]|nr:trypsin-like peptidase domain-containing protein [Rubrobacteraceae bacterium]